VKILLVVNSAASSVTARARVVIQRALAADHDLTVAETSRRGHASRLAQGAAADGADVVAVLGGDGTLNEAANGLAGTTTALGVLPGGSTNVFARTMGMVNDPVDASRQLLTALAAGSIRPVSLGWVNGRYFLFHVGFGYDAAVVAEVEKRSMFKRHLGAAVFLVAAVSTWTRGYDRSATWFTVRYPGPADGTGGGAPRRTDIEDGYFGICLKTSPYTFLGQRPVDLVPGTGFDTGLSMVTFRRLDLGTILPATVAAVRPGRAPRSRHIRIDRDVDYLGEAEHFDLRCQTDALRLVLPVGP
jgi:diacylglycerol kinase family enzyme